MTKLLRKMIESLQNAAARLLWPVGWFFTRVRKIRHIVRDLRVILLLLAILGLCVIWLPPGQDVVRDLVDESNATIGGLSVSDFWPVLWRWAFFIFACVWAGVSGWYWSDLLYKSADPHPDERPEQARSEEQPNWYRWLRRLIGLSPLFIAMWAMARIADPSEIWIAFAAFGVVTALMFSFFMKRRTITRLVTPSALQPTRFAHGRILAGDVWFVVASWVIALVLFAAFLWPTTRIELAWMLGPAAIAFLAISGIIAIASPLIGVARTQGVPLIAFALIVVAMGSLWNDNHAIRALDAPLQPRENLRTALQAWERQPGVTGDTPMVIVAAAGGASRAAYWTATVMRALDERTDGAFSRQTFAISSVSGGTLGAVGYAAWLADNPHRPGLADKDAIRDQATRRSEFLQTFFGTDFLGPAIAGMLYPDLLQRFIPLEVGLPSRATFLEQGWEKGWLRARREACGSSGCGQYALDGDFLDIWRGRLTPGAKGHWVPLVFINGAHVESGKRIITAPVGVTPDMVEDSYDFFDLFGKPVRASTAIHNSARFPVISPAGVIVGPAVVKYGESCAESGKPAGNAGAKDVPMKTIQCPRGRIVDGGYFENGGLETAYDLARAIRAVGVKRPIFIVEISNNDRSSPEDAARRNRDAVVGVREAKGEPAFLGGFTAIIGAMYNSGSAREVMSAKRFSDMRRSNGLIDRYFSFALKPYCQADRTSDGSCPSFSHTTMSWLVAQQSRYAMDVRMNTYEDGLDNLLGNKKNEEFRERLKAKLLRTVKDSNYLKAEAISLTIALRPPSASTLSGFATVPLDRNILNSIQRLAPRL